MGSHRQGGLLIASLVLALGACKSTRKDEGGGADKPAAASPTDQAGTSEADPHAGLDMSGGGGGDPHAGIPMGGGGGQAGAVPTVDADGRTVVGPVSIALPAEWKAEPTTSGMRAAQWKIPGAKGAGEAELVAFYFGPQGAGSVEENIVRWSEQFDAGGKPAVPKKTTREVGGMPMTLVEIEGRYVSSMGPGGPQKQDKPDSMMLGFILETKDGPYYYKLTGPKATVESLRKDFAQAVANIRPAQ